MQAARDAGLPFVIVTGRMYRSAKRYLDDLGLDGPVVCYQGAVVADADGRFLRHVPIPLEPAREAIAAIVAGGHHLNVYVDDELYVAEVTPEARAYADFQDLPIHPVGDLLAWLDEPPTKLVAVGERHVMDALEVELKERFDGRLYISKSLPEFLELAAPGVTKAGGARVRGRAPRRRPVAHRRVRRRRERRRARPRGGLRRGRRERARARARGGRLRLPARLGTKASRR